MKPLIAFVAFASLCFSLSVSAQGRTCDALKSALYAKPTLKIKVVFGYKDARPARYVGDRHERITFIQDITAPCDGSTKVCEFSRSHLNADLFTKSVQIAGVEKLIQLSVVNSSVGSDDEENRADPFQAWKSQYAQSTFLTSLKEADVVLYNGHSRFGGGPDFRPPVLTKSGKVDPSAYKSRRRSLNRLLSSLEESRQPKRPAFANLKVLGLYSCTSSQLFNEEIRKVSDAGLISSHVLMYYSDALALSLGAIDDVLEDRCPKTIVFN